MSEIPSLLRNRHCYGEPLEFRRVRREVEADERHAVDSWDLPDDHEANFWPSPWWATDSLRSPVPAMAGSREKPAASPPGWNPHSAAVDTSAAGGLGGVRPPAARPSMKDAA